VSKCSTSEESNQKSEVDLKIGDPDRNAGRKWYTPVSGKAFIRFSTGQRRASAAAPSILVWLACVSAARPWKRSNKKNLINL
jgi:hypothetical protein